MDTANKRKILDIKETLDHFPSYKVVPRDPKLWSKYLRDLRKNLLSMTQVEFWGLLNVKTVTGAKYESIYGGNSSRQMPEKLMVRTMQLLDLHWSPLRRYRTEDPDTGEITLTNEGSEVLDLLDSHNISNEDLKALIKLHQYYTNR